MASYTSIWDATTQEQSALQTEQLATLNVRIAKLEFELKAKSDAYEAAYVWAKGTFNKMNQFADLAESAEEEVERLQEEVEKLKTEARRLKKDSNENSDHLASLTREWQALKHPLTDEYRHDEEVDDFFITKSIREMLRNHTLIEWDRIDVHLEEHIDKLAEDKDEVVGRLVDAENTLSKAN
jgi:chromosome segregation ATPase